MIQIDYVAKLAALEAAIQLHPLREVLEAQVLASAKSNAYDSIREGSLVEGDRQAFASVVLGSISETGPFNDGLEAYLTGLRRSVTAAEIQAALKSLGYCW